MRDKFVLFAPGNIDAQQRGVIRVEPDTYNKVAVLSRKTGLSLCRIVSQAVEFALDHLEEDAEFEN